jgi:ABC-type glycerol-3-phosphate transport system substrate-binding protein
LNKRHLLLPCLLIVSALALVACGGSGSSAESEIEAAIETSATSGDPASCTKLETASFVEQSTGESGKAAIKACEEEAKKDPESRAKSVEVSEVEVDGSKATANAALSGGNFDGQAVSIALVEEEGDWKLDELTGFTKFDQGAIAQVFETQLDKSGELSSKQTSCIVEGIEEMPQGEIEEVILSGNSTPIEELAEGCA